MGRALLYLFGFLGLAGFAAWLVLPREPVDDVISFDPAVLPADLDGYLAESEAAFSDITPGVEKRIVWAGAPGAVTGDVVLYLHGFSATSEEIRPVPDRVAEALGANLLFWRLAGHGRTGDAMARATAGDWIEDTAEALAVAARLGGRVTVISTSTGGTLAAIAAIHPDLSGLVDRIVFVSPNFQIANPAARILRWPGARLWGPVVAGERRSFTPENADHARFWTTEYPTVATVPLGGLLNYVNRLEFGAASQPALFIFSDADQVVLATRTREVAGEWGGPVTLAPQRASEGDDPYRHVLAGDILSPGGTEPAIATILEWLSEL